MSTLIDVAVYKNDQVTRRNSEGSKLKVLSELRCGKYSKRQLSVIYGLQCSTINGWIKKYDRKELINTRIMVENQDNINRLKSLQKEIEQLKMLLLKKDLKLGQTTLIWKYLQRNLINNK